jgi:hypothetical protein
VRYSGHSYGAGLQGTLGIQWAATDWVALHAEYGVRCMYFHKVDEDEVTEMDGDDEHSVQTETIDRIFLDSRGVRFGLSAYF